MPTPTTKPRRAEGGAYASRGCWYARVTVAPGKRTGVLLPWAGPDDQGPANERARALQSLVSRLREVGDTSWIPKVLEIGATADAAKLGELETAVADIVTGKIVRDAPKGADVVTFAKLGEQWTDGTLHRLYPDHVGAKRTSRDDGYRLALLVDVELPTGGKFGDLPVAAVTLDVVDAVMARLDETRARRAGKAVKALRSASRRRYAQGLAFLMSVAA
jgi:hypothetical protein